MVKEYCEQYRMCVVTKEQYRTEVSEILEMIDEARKGFPLLTYDEIRVVVFDGPRRRRMLGIEFHVDDDVDVPGEYTRVRILDNLIV